MDILDLIQLTIPMLWTIKPTSSKTLWRSSYASKARVEYFLSHYISNDQFIRAAVELGIPHTPGDPNFLFAISPKFPTEWLHPDPAKRLTKRPPGAKRTEWTAYEEAHRWWDEMRDNLITHVDHQQDLIRAHDPQDDSVDDSIMLLTTEAEKIRYALRSPA